MQQEFLADVVRQTVKDSGLSYAQISRLSGIPAKTISSWANGYVKKPRYWQDLLRYAHAIQLSAADANRLLACTELGDLEALWRSADESDQELLSYWHEEDVPYQIPRLDVREVYGRSLEAAHLQDQLLLDGTICVIQGMGGIGKTTLATKTAHAMAHRFRDGVLWADLRNSSSSAILENWGQACGVDLTTLPDEKSRAARMWGVLGQKQMLIVLDDVVSAAQAQLLLPSRRTECAVIVTTRSQETAVTLTANPANIIQLQPFSAADSLHLLSHIIGKEVVNANRPTVEMICDLLGQLPLALTIVGRRYLALRQPLDQLYRRLLDIRTRLDHLHLGPDLGVRLAFEQSWELLDAVEQRAFAQLAVFEGRSFTDDAYASIGQMDVDVALDMVGRFYSLALLNIVTDTPRLYQQHTLLAAFATEKLHEDDPVWLGFCQYFCELVREPEWWHNSLQGLWSNVMAAMENACHLQEWQLVLAFNKHLEEAWRRLGLYSLARQGYAWALDAAHAQEDLAIEADIHLQWGRACLEQSAYEPAREHLLAALFLFEEQGHIAGIADSNYHLSRIDMEKGNYDAAEGAIQKAYHTYQQNDDVRGLARSLYRLGYIVFFRGVDFARAAQLAREAIRSQQGIEDKLGLLRSHMLAAQAFIQLEEIDAANQHYQVAAKLVEQIEDRAETAVYYYVYADLLRKQGLYADAHTKAHEALTLFREMADGSSEASALMLLASVEIRWNDAEPERKAFVAGLAYCHDGLVVCENVGYVLGKAYLLLMNGRLLDQQGKTANACTLWTQALTLARELKHDWLQRRLQTLIDKADCVSHRPPNHLSAQLPAP